MRESLAAILLKLINEELELSNKKHRDTFSSNHEAYAVTLEEVQEVFDNIKALDCGMDIIWKKVKKDDNDSLAINLCALDVVVLQSIGELLQVGAMAKKWRQFLDENIEI
jgi:hypothetical protein